MVEQLYRVYVFFGSIRDSTEDENEPVFEGTAGVVVTTLVQLWDFEPDIQIYVVLLALLVGSIILLSGSSDNDELIAQGAS